MTIIKSIFDLEKKEVDVSAKRVGVGLWGVGGGGRKTEFIDTECKTFISNNQIARNENYDCELELLVYGL